MAIKCSLLGHKFDGTQVEEEREEEGSEVVITIKEVEICDRCGKRRVVSENKEVTSLAASSGADADAAPEPDDAAGEEVADAGVDAETAPSPGPDMTAAEDDAELLETSDDADDAPAGGAADPDGSSASDPDPDPDIPTAGEPAVDDDGPSAEDDDAVILDDDEPERDPGEWPEDEAAPDEEAEPSADEDSEDAAAEETEVLTGDAESGTEEWPDEYGYEEESAKAPEVDWPEEDESDDEWEPSENLTQRIDADVEPAGAATVTVPDGEFHCTECDFTTLVEESSLRAGDFCPSCRRGTLEHRAEDATRKE
ncbi:DUF7093 family protein [Halorientalis halophila]|uniref:DUF7093 family protein n=1 Tax=Halorientalis halophila TaxID=3108499 RepID=UPI003009F250